MSQIKIDLDVVEDLNGNANQNIYTLSNVNSSVSSLVYHVDSAITARRNIRSRLQSTSQSLRELETSLKELNSFIKNSIDRYSRTETELNKKALSIGEGSHKRTFSSLFVETIHQASKMRDDFESKSKHWIDQGAQFVNDYIDGSTYKGQNQRVVQRFIKGTILDNKVTHMLIKTVDEGFQLKSHFEAGVAKGVVDSVAGLAKLGTTVSAIQQKINPLTMSLEAAAYVVDTASSADPFRKVKQDMIDSVEHSVEIGKSLSQIPGKLYEAAAETAHEFGQADANHKADMLGYGSEKIAEVLIPFAGVAIRGAKVAEEGAVLVDDAAKLAQLEKVAKRDGAITGVGEAVTEMAEQAVRNALAKGSKKTWDEFLKEYPEKSIEEASNSYIKLIEGQSPWPEGFDITTHTSKLKPGDKFQMALDSSQPVTSPGNFATFDEITNINFVRNNLAVKSDWKADCSKVVTYRVKEGVELPVVQGPVGPQIDLNADKYLPGGGSQIQMLLNRGVNKMDYLEVVSVSSIN